MLSSGHANRRARAASPSASRMWSARYTGEQGPTVNTQDEAPLRKRPGAAHTVHICYAKILAGSDGEQSSSSHYFSCGGEREREGGGREGNQMPGELNHRVWRHTDPSASPQRGTNAPHPQPLTRAPAASPILEPECKRKRKREHERELDLARAGAFARAPSPGSSTTPVLRRHAGVPVCRAGSAREHRCQRLSR